MNIIIKEEGNPKPLFTLWLKPCRCRQWGCLPVSPLRSQPSPPHVARAILAPGHSLGLPVSTKEEILLFVQAG